MIQPSIGLYFTSHPATKLPMLLQFENDATLDIPAGDEHFLVTDEFTLPIDVDLLAIYPHAHYLGKDIQAFATLPDGEQETLIHIPQWNLNWQAVYRYAEPVLLPKGTIISLRYVYDNSQANPLNPNHPPARVKGWQPLQRRDVPPLAAGTSGEFRCPHGDPRMLLQEALAQHHVEKNPADFEAHYNLAAMFQAKGKLDLAMDEYRSALRLRPEDAIANNAIGSALLAEGHPDQAGAFLEAALKARPDYFDAHYNLGNVLAAEDDFKGASKQILLALEARPADANAEANLGSALAEMGKFSEAKLHFERALQVDPGNMLAKENLAELQRTMNQK